MKRLSYAASRTYGSLFLLSGKNSGSGRKLLWGMISRCESVNNGVIMEKIDIKEM